ncbi:tRNA 2-selenouridine(34) synthase MnmH [Terrimonas sp. NA20]|uniref:tRNA 2-selenouridine(34) synthase MnmH n=1 Tax=Terrimonas ginsenosidimutans TaxID=2908004 RepID=A0ABS9KP13_9BACT|nr:tRNA 2-selenouridine(34) synthase MnmH [Terrimonas ginsenosidimutans]MCG2614075.1 tRNA 2-selenouridine(34) synthase MnmH [Terrimonas ginsenosidimutans]
MIHSINVSDLLDPSFSMPVADVRTPAEFEQAHIPGAVNLPLFSNEERVQVGTTYKQVGKQAAILLGFDLTGNKWSGFIRQALTFAPDKKITLHCWRGGMRSGAMAWALNLYGFEVYVLQGGYKAYRRWALQQFEKEYRLKVIGGMTGSGKTKLLRQLKNIGQPVIDLEDIAQHQGSAYGSLNKLVQPTQEQFENRLAFELNRFSAAAIWVEDESISIGKRYIPRKFWQQIQQAILFDLQIPPETRLQNLVEEYGCLDKEFLIECTQRIRKRLGPDQTKKAITAIEEDRMDDFIRQVIVYYDKTYKKGIADRSPDLVIPVSLGSQDISLQGSVLLSAAQEQNNKSLF